MTTTPNDRKVSYGHDDHDDRRDPTPGGPAKAASQQPHLGVHTGTGLEAILKELFPILRPVPLKVLVGGFIAIVAVVSVLVIAGAAAGRP